MALVDSFNHIPSTVHLAAIKYFVAWWNRNFIYYSRLYFDLNEADTRFCGFNEPLLIS